MVTHADDVGRQQQQQRAIADERAKRRARWQGAVEDEEGRLEVSPADLADDRLRQIAAAHGACGGGGGEEPQDPERFDGLC